MDATPINRYRHIINKIYIEKLTWTVINKNFLFTFHIYQQFDTRITSEATMYSSHSVTFSVTNDDLWWLCELHILALNKFWCMDNTNRYDMKNTQIFTAKNIVTPFHDYKHIITYTQISAVLGHERLCYPNYWALPFRPSLPWSRYPHATLPKTEVLHNPDLLCTVSQHFTLP